MLYNYMYDNLMIMKANFLHHGLNDSAETTAIAGITYC